MLDQIFINVGHLYKFPPQNINTHVYEHRQAVDMAAPESLNERERMWMRNEIKGEERGSSLPPSRVWGN